MPKVAVLVSVYNKAWILEKCLESLLKVDFPEKKIFVIDNYSSDGSFEILEKYRDRLQLFRQKGSYSAILNWALDSIDAEYLAITDADCVVDADWLRYLLTGFSEAGVIATAGYCGTPMELKGVQKAIGLDMESRFKRFPQYLLRAPTMNLCLRLDIAKIVRFDESIKFVVEPDFGYRLTKLGKMKYIPSAKVWHYHRPNIGSYFKQQLQQSRGAVYTYLKHKRMSFGDHISTPVMMLQVPLGISIFLGLGLVLFYHWAGYWVIISAFALLSIYLYSLLLVSTVSRYYPYLLLIFFIRTFAWTIGCVIGLLDNILSYVKKTG